MIIKLSLINIEFLKRMRYRDFEKKRKILECLKKNQNQAKQLRNHLWQLKVSKNNKSRLTKQVDRCCLTGRTKAYIKNFNLSRHAANLHAFEGLLQNTKTKSW
uniref:Small ribosomal subunit protein uS14m n=1 Tax=Paramecium tetraurelia TaxID=5888 RepID=RT14_PARTE|nr:unnamed protein product [Paramecium aurelia]P15759.1 RecName: Full=Small ribosomal subunit protein uS14m; AltName: Full=Ribosomal protein S14, mitochondrial [Paramecium tetraurelia]CAA34041.1 unnamed protein product [Paramecium aurelia]